jgi:hypothetical protein
MPYTSRWIRAAGLGVLVALVGLTGSLTACGRGTTNSPSASETFGTTPTPTPTPVPPTTANPTPPPGGGGGSTTGTGNGQMPTPLSVVRTGGFIGVNQSLSVKSDGSWTYQDRNSGESRTGRFTSNQRQQLVRLAADPDVAREARKSPPPVVCNDTFVYALRVGEVSVRFDECWGDDRPAVNALLDMLMAATPF